MAEHPKKKKKKTKSMLRKALDLAIRGKRSIKGSSGNVNQRKQLDELEEKKK